MEKENIEILRKELLEISHGLLLSYALYTLANPTAGKIGLDYALEKFISSKRFGNCVVFYEK